MRTFKGNGTVDIGSIEQASFSIIEQEAGNHGFPPDRWAVVARMIHSTADFEYLSTVRFHKQAISRGVAAIRAGAPVFTDTAMAMAGIRKSLLGPYGVRVECLIGEPVVGRRAAAQGVTRAHAAVDEVIDRLDGCIYAVGNAPTALLRLVEIIRAGRAAPSLVIGLPVGFVNVIRAKQALLQQDVAYITNTSRKGGSNVAAAVINALGLLAG